MNRESKIEHILLQWDHHRQNGEAVDVDSLCEECPELADEIRQKLSALQQMYGLLEVPEDSEPKNDVVDERWQDIPGYEYIDFLGAGGMGLVYKVREISLDRIVALKLIRDSALATRQRLTRFQAEAETVAKLKHANIVQVFQVGQHHQQPFLTLEYVEGNSLDQAIDGRPMDPSYVVQLMEAIARAVHYAHQKGVIHRDLKPANILLHSEDKSATLLNDETKRGNETRVQEDTQNPELSHRATDIPKIVDFGIAKCIDDDRKVTLTGDVLGTPSYMSPEQALGDLDRISTTTDVYGLGTILYEMLTGRPPFLAPTTLETLEQVKQRNPVSPSQLQPGLSSDLENICLKCLEKEPGRRYASANDLADDLFRFRSHQPVLARPVSGWEKAWRWCRRNPTVAALSFALVLALLLGSAGVTWKWQEAEASNRRSEIALTKARQAIDEYFTLTSEEVLLDQPGLQELRRDLLQTALSYYQELIEEYGSEFDPNSELARDVGVAHAKVGHVLMLLGRSDESRLHLTRSIELHEEILTQQPGDHSTQFSLAKAVSDLAVLFYQIGENDQFEVSIDRAIDLAQKIINEDDQFTEAWALLANDLRLRGMMLAKRDQVEEGIQSYQEAIEICRRFAESSDEAVAEQNQYLLGQSYVALAESHFDQGNWEQAERELNASTQLLRHLAESHEMVQKYQSALSVSLDRLANLSFERGEIAKAFESFQEAEKITCRLAVSNPKVVNLQQRWAARLQNVGATALELEKLDDARDAIYQAEANLLDLTRRFPGQSDALETLANVYTNLGGLQSMQGNPEQAIVSLRRPVAIMEQLSKQYPDISKFKSSMTLALNNLSKAQFEQGDLEPATESQKRATIAAGELVAKFPDIPEYQFIYVAVKLWSARLAMIRGDISEGAKHFESVVQNWDQVSQLRVPSLKYQTRMIGAVYALGRYQAESGQYADSYSSLKLAADAATELVQSHPHSLRNKRQLSQILTMLAVSAHHIGKPTEAKGHYENASEMIAQLVKDGVNVENTESAMALHSNLGNYQESLGNRTKSKMLFRKTIRLGEKLEETGRAQVNVRKLIATAKTNLATSLIADKEWDQAIKQCQEANDIIDGLLQQFPRSTNFLTVKVVSLNNLGNALRSQRKFDGAINAFDQSLKLLDQIAEINPDDSGVNQRVFVIRWGRARCLNFLKQYEAAAKDWRIAFQHAPKRHQQLLQMEEAWSLNKAGMHQRAFATAEAMVEANPNRGDVFFAAARLAGQSIKAMVGDPPADVSNLREQYESQLLDWLYAAKSAKYFAGPNRLKLLNNPDFSEVVETKRFKELAKILSEDLD